MVDWVARRIGMSLAESKGLSFRLAHATLHPLLQGRALGVKSTNSTCRPTIKCGNRAIASATDLTHGVFRRVEVASRAKAPFFIQERTNSQAFNVKRKKKEIIIFLAKMKIQPFFLLFFHAAARDIFSPPFFFIKNCSFLPRVVPLFCLNIIVILVETT